MWGKVAAVQKSSNQSSQTVWRAFLRVSDPSRLTGSCPRWPRRRTHWRRCWRSHWRWTLGSDSQNWKPFLWWTLDRCAACQLDLSVKNKRFLIKRKVKDLKHTHKNTHSQTRSFAHHVWVVRRSDSFVVKVVPVDWSEKDVVLYF